MDIKKLNRFAQRKVSLNTPKNWLELQAMIEKYKSNFEVQPYNFYEIDFSDFTNDCRSILTEIVQINNEKSKAVNLHEYQKVIDLREKERVFVEKLTDKTDFKFFDGSYFKVNNQWVVQHLFYFKLLPQSENRNVDVVRGIVSNLYRKNNTKLGVQTATHNFYIDENILSVKLNEDDKILGVVIDDKIKICYDITLINEEKLFGFIIDNDKNGNYLCQSIDGFNKQNYYPFEAPYPKGKRIGINTTDIKSISIL